LCTELQKGRRICFNHKFWSLSGINSTQKPLLRFCYVVMERIYILLHITSASWWSMIFTLINGLGHIVVLRKSKKKKAAYQLGFLFFVFWKTLVEFTLGSRKFWNFWSKRQQNLFRKKSLLAMRWWETVPWLQRRQKTRDLFKWFSNTYAQFLIRAFFFSISRYR
jgi:hypothetical protein